MEQDYLKDKVDKRLKEFEKHIDEERKKKELPGGEAEEIIKSKKDEEPELSPAEIMLSEEEEASLPEKKEPEDDELSEEELERRLRILIRQILQSRGGDKDEQLEVLSSQFDSRLVDEIASEYIERMEFGETEPAPVVEEDEENSAEKFDSYRPEENETYAGGREEKETYAAGAPGNFSGENQNYAESGTSSKIPSEDTPSHPQYIEEAKKKDEELRRLRGYKPSEQR